MRVSSLSPSILALYSPWADKETFVHGEDPSRGDPESYKRFRQEVESR
jgi:hypothetical protein